MKSYLKTTMTAFAFVASASTVMAQAADGCLVEQAAKAALDREIQLIKATATDVEATFNGPDGCIDGSIFNDFDLSMAIPDLAGMLTSISTNFIQDAIQNAKNKVCKQINDQIQDVVGNASGAVSTFNSGLSDELRGVLDNGWDISL